MSDRKSHCIFFTTFLHFIDQTINEINQQWNQLVSCGPTTFFSPLTTDMEKAHKVGQHLPGQTQTNKWWQIKFSFLWLTSLSRYERTASVSFNNATLHFPLRWRGGGKRRHVKHRHRKWAALDLSCSRLDGWLSMGTACRHRGVYSTWCVSRVDSHTAGRERALCGEAGVSVFLWDLSLSGSPSPLPTPLQKANRGNKIRKHINDEEPWQRLHHNKDQHLIHPSACKILYKMT